LQPDDGAESNKLAKSWMDLCVLTQGLSRSLCLLKYFHLPYNRIRGFFRRSARDKREARPAAASLRCKLADWHEIWLAANVYRFRLSSRRLEPIDASGEKLLKLIEDLR
jgi:hypothetical protein